MPSCRSWASYPVGDGVHGPPFIMELRLSPHDDRARGSATAPNEAHPDVVVLPETRDIPARVAHVVRGDRHRAERRDRGVTGTGPALVLRGVGRVRLEVRQMEPGSAVAKIRGR